jgi:hypothetical protein
MNQNDYVNWVRTLERHDPDETYEDAHFPVPQSQGGTETIKLHWYDHAIQGVFQSEEYGDKLFFPGHARKALYDTPGFCAGWFEACELYEKWVRMWKGMTHKIRSDTAKKTNAKRGPEHMRKMWEERKFPVTCTHMDTNEVLHFVSSQHAQKTLGLSPAGTSMAISGGRPHHKRWIIERTS